MAREFNSVNTVKSAPKNKSFLDRMKDKIAKNQYNEDNSEPWKWLDDEKLVNP